MQVDRLRDGHVFRWVVCLVSVQPATFMGRPKSIRQEGDLFSVPRAFSDTQLLLSDWVSSDVHGLRQEPLW